MQLRRTRGFTLVELIVVIVVMGVLAGGMIAYFKPAITNYMDVARRASLANQADGALRMMTTEVRIAVPNSLRLIGDQCLELLPTSDGGRFRTAPDTVWDAANPGNPSKYMDITTGINGFDVLSSFSKLPAAGDWVIIGNQNGNDAYASSRNRVRIAGVGAPPSPSLGTSRISILWPAPQFPVGYEGGRFVIVPDTVKAVSYICTGTGLDATGSGTGKLVRISNYGFNTTQVCPAVQASTPVLANKVESCSFNYDPAAGATQQSGFVEVQLKLTDQGESVALSYSAYVSNVP